MFFANYLKIKNRKMKSKTIFNEFLWKLIKTIFSINKRDFRKDVERMIC